jgi:hypothetical protein
VLFLASSFFIGPALLSGLWVHGYVLGLIHAGALGVYAVAVTSTFFAHTRAVGLMAGAWGEDLTRDELDKARRRRLVWGSVHGVATAGGDVDHLVVTRSGGVLAVDSKWRNDPDRDDLVRDAAAATAAARRAQLVLRSLHHPVAVTPVVAVWGAGRRSVPAAAEVDGVPFVDGGQLVRWMGSLSSQPVDRDTARRLLRDLRSFRQRVQPEIDVRR